MTQYHNIYTTLAVRYTCRWCGIEEADIAIPARQSPEEDLMEWMDELAKHITEDHSQRSPDCKSITMDRVRIPMKQDDPNGWIGKPQCQK